MFVNDIKGVWILIQLCKQIKIHKLEMELMVSKLSLQVISKYCSRLSNSKNDAMNTHRHQYIWNIILKIEFEQIEKILTKMLKCDL